ncbi:MAG: hypothetical protein WEB52_07575 [Dehalococcoidia bacterium]
MATTPSEQALLKEIAALAARVRALRKPGVRQDGREIQGLEAQSRAKWGELRSLRAGAVDAQSLERFGRSSRQ